MKKIYAVSSGEYSDYSVLAVSEDKATAEAWAKALQYEEDGWRHDARVEDMLLIERGEEPAKIHSVSLNQDLWDDEREGKMRVSERDEFPIAMLHSPPPSRPNVRFVRAPCHNGIGGRLEVYGRTTEAVMKVYSEQKAMWKASPLSFKR